MRRVINVTGRSGHTDTIYRSDADLKAGERLEKGEVKEKDARKVFDTLMADSRGAMVPFAVAPDGSIEEMKKFDPKVQEIAFVAKIAGGASE